MIDSNKSLKKGERVFLSKMGHRGFYYPTQDFETLMADVEADPLPWIGGGSMRAFLIPASAIKALVSGEINTPVWIKK